jgi:indolepyruvate ferredoxin oxidoreductase alpha subunit
MKALNFEGYARVSIEDIVKAVGVKHVSTIRPYRVKKSIDSIKDALMYKGVSVIISQEPCTLFAKALKKPRGKPFFVSEKCKGHRDCINDLACPAFFIKKNRVCIDPVLCSGCSVCAQICPEHAILPLRDKI